MQRDALIRYLRDQLHTARLNLPRVYATADPENLHRFRVALRRTRSLLQLYLPESHTLLDTIRTVFKPTNILRELDLLLLSLEKSSYPKLYEAFQSYRDERYRLVVTQIYIEQSMRLLEKLIDELLAIKVVYTDEELINKALKHYRKTKTAYKMLTSDSKAKELHRVRIEFKTSRYALEFLKESGLTSEKKKRRYAEQKQDQLGALHDAYSQLLLLKQFCKASQLDECRRLYKKRKKAYRRLFRSATSNLSE